METVLQDPRPVPRRAVLPHLDQVNPNVPDPGVWVIEPTVGGPLVQVLKEVRILAA